MSGESLSRGRLFGTALVRLIIGVVLLSALLFAPAGTFDYWEAWVYLAALFVPMTLVFAYLLAYDPKLLERRLRAREPSTEQGLIMIVGAICYGIAFVLPGFDRRFNWSEVPTVAVIAADVVFVIAYALFVRVLRENTFASRVVEVEAGQRVISTGPYAVVRHPMYVAVLVMFTATPIALGSWWALLAMVPEFAVIVARIRNEEQVLARDLAGYTEYMRTTPYRLIPGVW